MVDYFEGKGWTSSRGPRGMDRLCHAGTSAQAQELALTWCAGGMTVAEVAAAMETVTTVEHDWRLGAGLARRPAREEMDVIKTRWRRIGELFKAVVRIDSAGREVWLRAACTARTTTCGAQVATAGPRRTSRPGRVSTDAMPESTTPVSGANDELAPPPPSLPATARAGRLRWGRAGQRRRRFYPEAGDRRADLASRRS